jgi:hypothetical protein
MGNFTGPSEQYGVPLSFIHPKDNDFAKAKFNPILLDPRWKLTDKQRRELQQKADDLAGLMGYGRDKFSGKPEAPKRGGRASQARR